MKEIFRATDIHCEYTEESYSAASVSEKHLAVMADDTEGKICNIPVRYTHFMRVSYRKRYMFASTEKLIDAGFRNRVISTDDLYHIFGGSPRRIQSLVYRAMSSGELIRLRRGFYILCPKYRSQKPVSFHLANQMVKESHVSFESALSFHGWIPESISVVTSAVRSSRSRIINTALGRFEYVHIPLGKTDFLTMVERVDAGIQSFLVASAIRALADIVYERKLQWTGIEFITESLRVDEHELKAVDRKDFELVISVFRSGRVRNFLRNLEQELFQ